MATMLTTRLWESEDSADSIVNRYPENEPAPNWIWNTDKDHIHWPQQLKRSSKSASRTTILATPRGRKNNTAVSKYPTKIRNSALLYEITDRQNKLARPKTQVFTASHVSQQSFPGSHVSRATTRVTELARPKNMYIPPAKAAGYIAPSALRAVATQRIIELSTPRKMRSPRAPKKRKSVYAPCSARITYLSRPKHVVDCRGEATKNFLRRSPPQVQQPPWVVPTYSWKQLGYSATVAVNPKKKRKRKRKGKVANGTRSATTKSITFKPKKKARRRARAAKRPKLSKLTNDIVPPDI